MKNYKGNTLNKIKLMEDINLGDYTILNDDYQGNVPPYVINNNGEAIIKKGTELFHGDNPFNASSILIDENENALDVCLDENDYIIIKQYQL